MPPPDEDLSEALAQLARRQSELEERVRALEGRRAATPPPLPQMDPPAPKPEWRPPPPEIIPPEIVPQEAPVAEGVRLETTFGLNWINRIAVVTLLLGAAFLFKYGVDNDWFGPGARVALGIAAAVISLLAGHRLWRRGQNVFAQGIIGLGLALFYLSIYAAAMLYHLLPPSLAFVAMSAVTGGAVGLALLYGSQAIAVIALIGGYLTPPALSTGEDHPWILFGYLLLLNTGALILARVQRWKALEPIAAAATILLYWTWLNEESDISLIDVKRLPATVFAFVFYAQFSVATLAELWAVFQLGASMALMVVWREQAHFAWWNLPIAAGGLATAYLRRWSLAPIWTLGCFWLPFWLWYSPEAPFGAISAAFLIFFAWALWRVPDQAPGLGLIAANAAVYYAASYSLLNPTHHEYMGLLAAGVGGIHLLLARDFETHSNARTLTFGVALAFVTLAVPIQFVGFRVTIAWALEGAALAWLSARSQSRALRIFCWTVLTLAVFRVLAFDAFVYSLPSEYATLLNARFLTFAVATGALWLTARFLAPAVSKESIDAAVSYIAGHAVLLFGLGLEIAGWVGRNIAPENQNNVEIIAISVMMTLYAVILVLVGIQTRAAIHRILGLALVVLVVAKLYLVDVWVLGRLFRITAFLALGVLLLALSYLYSRLKPALTRLLRPDSSA